MIFLTAPRALLGAKPGGVPPQDVAGIAMVGGQRAENVTAAEIGHLYEAVLGRCRVVAMDF